SRKYKKFILPEPFKRGFNYEVKDLYAVVKEVIHPKFHTFSGFANLGLIQVDRKFTTYNKVKISPVCLKKSDDVKIGTKVLSHSRRMKLSVTNSTLCKKWFPKKVGVFARKFPFKSDSQICVEYSEACSLTCEVLPATPLLIKNGEVFTQVGILLQTEGNKYKGYPAVFTKISSFWQWIKDTTQCLQ
ncbi:Trypsin-like protein, partial [Leptotrombidium deliense]